MGFLVWFNLLETGDMNAPVPSTKMHEIMLGLDTDYERLDRKTKFIAAGATDRHGNIMVEALERSARAWLKISKGKKLF